MADRKLSDKEFADALASLFRNTTGFSHFRKLNANVEASLENAFSMGLGETLDWEQIVSEGNKKISAIGKVLSVLKKEERAYKDLDKYLGKFRMAGDAQSRPGRGALSPGQAWGAAGWTLTEKGWVWHRPPNVQTTEHFPRQATGFVASYDENPDAVPIDPNSTMLPVTSEQAKRLRQYDEYDRKERESRDAMWARISKKQDEFSIADLKKHATVKENLAKLGMSEYELFIHENMEAYGGRAGADLAFRQRLLKDLPSFFKDSKLSTKQLVSIQKSLSALKSTPIIGRTLGKMVANPVSGISAMALAGIASVFNVSDRANKSVISWKNAANLYGIPNKKFANAALLAGLNSPKDIMELYGKLTEQYGDPEAVLSAFGDMFAGMGKREKTLVAKNLGLDPTTVALIDILSGSLTPDKTRTTTALRTKVENTKEFGFRTGGTIGQFIQSLWLSVMGGAQARDASKLKYVEEGVEENFNKIFDDMKERQGDTSMTSSTRNSAIYITNMNVATNDPKAFSEALEGMAEDNNRGLIATSGNYVLA